MKTHKKQASVIGVLFLIALFLNLIASELMNPLIDSPDFLTLVFPKTINIVAGNFLNIICAFAMAFIPLVLYPLVQNKYRSLALGYIVFRCTEGVLFLYMAIKTFCFIDLSKGYLNTIDKTYVLVGSLLRAELRWVMIVYLVAFCMGGFLFYTLLLRSRLVPVWLSTWGLIGVFILSTGTTMGILELGVFGNVPLMKGMVYFAPAIALNEFVLSCRLIFKGFKQTNLKAQFY